jgi:hypothetical protein
MAEEPRLLGRARRAGHFQRVGKAGRRGDEEPGRMDKGPQLEEVEARHFCKAEPRGHGGGVEQEMGSLRQMAHAGRARNRFDGTGGVGPPDARMGCDEGGIWQGETHVHGSP